MRALLQVYREKKIQQIILADELNDIKKQILQGLVNTGDTGLISINWTAVSRFYNVDVDQKGIMHDARR
jgi:hypothetical protein